MFLNEGVACPRQITEAVSTLVITRLVEETDHLAVLPRDVAEYYAERGQLSILPVRLACKMDSCGIITSKSRSLSPSGRLVRDAFAVAAAELTPKSAGERKSRAREPEPAEQPFATRVWKNLQGSEPLS
jgi:DNA-binding transcriptional LysR family regulator